MQVKKEPEVRGRRSSTWTRRGPMHMMDVRGPGSRRMMLLEGLWEGSESLWVREIGSLFCMLVVVAWVGWVGLNWYFRVSRVLETIMMK